MTVSVLVLTLNEEANLPRCLESVSWSDDVVVLDSHSTDNTREVAKAHGARVFVREFDNYAGQRNYGLRDIEYKHSWLLMVDADEVVSSSLRDEILHRLRNADEGVCLFRMRRKDFLFGKWLKRSSGYPTWFGRLARRGRVWVEREINEEYHTDGSVAALEHHLHHYPFNKGFGAWFDKHNRYSTMEALRLAVERERGVPWRQLLSKDPVVRRKAAKQFFYSLPARPIWAFLGLYVVRGGALDGKAGLTFSALRAVYEWMIDLKTEEQRRRALREPV